MFHTPVSSPEEAHRLSSRRVISSVVDRLNATEDQIHCPPAQIHPIADHMNVIADGVQLSPCETQAIAERMKVTTHGKKRSGIA